MAQTQVNVRGGVLHVQHGEPGNYSKHDVPVLNVSRSVLAALLERALSGATANSLYGSATQYVVLPNADPDVFAVLRPGNAIGDEGDE